MPNNGAAITYSNSLEHEPSYIHPNVLSLEMKSKFDECSNNVEALP